MRRRYRAFSQGRRALVIAGLGAAILGTGASAPVAGESTPGMAAAPTQTSRAADVAVSNGEPGTHHYPAVAVSSDTGDILVAWQQTVGAGTTILGRILERQGDGTHVPAPAFTISADATFNGNPDVAWLPWLGRYIVVWDTFDPANGLVPTAILGTDVRLNGNTGKLRTIVGEKSARTNYYPRLGVDPFQEKLLLSYTALPNLPGDKKTGVVFTFINDKLKSRGKKLYTAKAVFKTGRHTATTGRDPGRRSDLASVPENRRIEFWEGLGFATSGVIDQHAFNGSRTFPTLNPRNQMTWLVTDDNGLKDAFQAFTGNGGDSGAVIPIPADPTGNQFGHLRESMFIRGTFDGEFRDDIYGGDLDGYLLIGSDVTEGVDGAYLPRNYDNDIPGQNADLPILRSRLARGVDAQFAHLLVPKGKFIYRQPLLWTGPDGARTIALGKAKKLFNTRNRLVWLATASDPTLGVKAAAWTKTKNANTNEVRIFIYE